MYDKLLTMYHFERQGNPVLLHSTYLKDWGHKLGQAVVNYLIYLGRLRSAEVLLFQIYIMAFM